MKHLKNAHLPILGSTVPLPCVWALFIGNHKQTDFEGAYSGNLKWSISPTMPRLDGRGGRMYSQHWTAEQLRFTARLCKAEPLSQREIVHNFHSL